MTCIEHIGGCDYRVALPNGRGLGFAQYGDPCGKPVVSFHGGLSCRLDSQFADALSRQAGVRLIAPDRPGIGLSDPLPEGTLLDYPDDVVYLADALGIERFAALGWSAGGAYALACAYKIPGRLTRVGLIASVAPLRHLGGAAVSGLGVDRVLLSLSRTLPKAAALILEGCRFGPPALMKQVVSRHVPSRRASVCGSTHKVAIYRHSPDRQPIDLRVVERIALTTPLNSTERPVSGLNGSRWPLVPAAQRQHCPSSSGSDTLLPSCPSMAAAAFA